MVKTQFRQSGRTLHAICRMIKIEHSVFALPFALSGAFMAAGGWPGWAVILPLVVAMVSIRSFAMTWNRLADFPFDKQNPRTQERELVSGKISFNQAKLFALAAALLFLLACFTLNTLCLQLGIPALALAAGYSYCKRFTWLCHFALGLVLGLSPLAGWLSVSSSLTITPVLLFWAVVFWVAGFDILYAIQDMDFDRKSGLHSLPAQFGLECALQTSLFCHVNTIIFLFLSGIAANLSLFWQITWATIAFILLWEHKLVKPNDLSRINAAFFTLNGIVAFLTFAGIAFSIP